jgi:endonuclease/exonuclease/phosphatase family metal-dependent hydrolase
MARTFPRTAASLLRSTGIYVRNAIIMHRSLPAKPWSHLSDHAPLAAQIEPVGDRHE